MNRALVVVAGPTTDQPVGIDRRTSDVVIAADGGAALADVLGWRIDALVGDFDSIEPDTLARTRAAGATVRAFPSDKDETDLELALAEARERAADEVIVVGGGGGRLDHLLGVIAALSGPIVRDPGWRPRVEARLDGQRVVAVDDSWSERLDEDAVFSVIAVTDLAEVSIAGARWELDHHVLRRGSSLGMSNRAMGPSTEVTVWSGSVLVVLPVLPAANTLEATR